MPVVCWLWCDVCCLMLVMRCVQVAVCYLPCDVWCLRVVVWYTCVVVCCVLWMLFVDWNVSFAGCGGWFTVCDGWLNVCELVCGVR